MSLALNEVLKIAFQAGASDVHLVNGEKPAMRCQTVMTSMDLPVLTPDVMTGYFKSMAGPEDQERFKAQGRRLLVLLRGARPIPRERAHASAATWPSRCV